VTDQLRRNVLEVYAAADAAVAAAGPRCDASGRCCRFTEYGHTLFISHFEAEILLESSPGFPQPVSRDGCPFQVNGLCTARESRPLGCRIYFCDPAYEPRMVEITEECLARLKAIADEHGTGWEYAPLHHFMNAARPATPAGDSMNPPDTRHPLTVLPEPGG
jgi:hypothetical protein